MSDFRAIRVIDCTLRDGAYRLPQGFSAAETARIAAGLEAAGMPVVELGHGLGLGAPAKHLSPDGDSDEAYLRAGRGALDRARMAALAIPGIAALEDIGRAADLGLDILRVGIDLLRAEEALPYLAEGRRRGLETHASLLKASMVGPDGFARAALRMAEGGAQHVGLYDSAGALLPGQVAAMVAAARAEVTAGLAFHGHNNLGLAIANSLAAVEAGAATVDCTLRGVGRSAGNAATEVFVLAARRAGLVVPGDFVALGRMSQEEILPIFGPIEIAPEDAGMGFAGLHSDGLALVREVAAARRIAPLTLLLALAAHPPVARLTREAVEEAASLRAARAATALP